MSIIEDMYYGNIDMQDSFCDNDKYRQALKALADADLKLRSSLNKEQIALLEQARLHSLALGDVSGVALFTEGFRLGAKLMLEILCPEDE